MKKKKKMKKALFWGGILVVFGALFIRQQIIMSRLNRQYTELQDHKAIIEKENADLNEKLKLTQREDYIESMARQKLGLIKPGEILIRDKNKKR